MLLSLTDFVELLVDSVVSAAACDGGYLVYRDELVRLLY